MVCFVIVLSWSFGSDRGTVDVLFGVKKSYPTVRVSSDRVPVGRCGGPKGSDSPEYWEPGAYVRGRTGISNRRDLSDRDGDFGEGPWTSNSGPGRGP